MGVLLFMHPAGTPDLQNGCRERAAQNVIGNPLDYHRALAFDFDGTLDRFPPLKLCAAMSGYLPSYATAPITAVSRSGSLQAFTPLKKKPSRIFAAALFRFAGVHARSAARI